MFSYDSQQPDELSFDVNDQMTILRKGDDAEREWWWARMECPDSVDSGRDGREGYVPRNLLGVSSFQSLIITCGLFELDFVFYFTALSESSINTAARLTVS